MPATDRELIADLLALFTFAHDDGDLDGVVGCFVPDGVLRVWRRQTPDDVAEHRGHDAIRANTERSFSLRALGRRHLTTNILVRERPGARDTAERRYDVTSYLTIVDNQPEGAKVTATAVYLDDVVVSDDRALLVSRGVALDAEPFTS